MKSETVNEFNSHLTLCYVGGSHFSSDLHSTQEKNFVMSEEETSKSLTDLKNLAIKIKDCLLMNDLESIGNLMHESYAKLTKSSIELQEFFLQKFNEYDDTSMTSSTSMSCRPLVTFP